MIKTKKALCAVLVPILLLCLILTACGKTPAGTETGPAEQTSVGDSAAGSDFIVYDANGEEVAFPPGNGKPVVVNLWATWCPPCRAELPHFEEAYAQYGDKVDFLMIDMTDGERETQPVVRDFLDENGYTFPVFYDLGGGAARFYNAAAIPVTVLLDRDGGVYASHVGMIERDALFSAIETLLG